MLKTRSAQPSNGSCGKLDADEGDAAPKSGRRFARAVSSMFHERSIAISRPRGSHRHQLAGQPPGAAAGVDDALVAATVRRDSTRWPHAVCGAETLWYEAAFHSFGAGGRRAGAGRAVGRRVGTVVTHEKSRIDASVRYLPTASAYLPTCPVPVV